MFGTVIRLAHRATPYHAAQYLQTMITGPRTKQTPAEETTTLHRNDPQNKDTGGGVDKDYHEGAQGDGSSTTPSYFAATLILPTTLCLQHSVFAMLRRYRCEVCGVY